MINILFVSHSSNIGGSEKDLLLLLKGLDRERFRPLVVCPREGYLTREMDKLGVPWELCRLPWWLRGPEPVCPHYLLDRSWEGDLSRLSSGEFFALAEEATLSRLRRLVDLIREHDFQVVHTNCFVILDGALAAGMAGVPHVWHLHEVDVGHPGLVPRLPAVARYGLLDALSDAVVVVSEYHRTFFAPWVAPARLRLVYNGVESLYGHLAPEDPARLKLRRETRAELGLVPDDLVICSVGSAFPVKGWIHLVKAAALVAARHSRLRLVLVGAKHEPHIREVAREVESRGLTGLIQFTGVREDAQRLMLAADLVCQPSLWESLSLVDIEAASLSLPVVASRCGGVEEVVRHGKNGLVVPVGDHVALAAALTVLLDHPEVRRDFGAAGREIYLEKFQPAYYVSQFAELYQELAARGPHRSRPDPGLLEIAASLYGALLGSVLHTENCQSRLEHIQAASDPRPPSPLCRLRRLLGKKG